MRMRGTQEAHERLTKKKEEMFLIVFDHANACERMRKHAFAGQNTQQT